ncbi:MAG: agmatinase [Candidatus Micrarchaeia archaeon]
MEDIVIPGKFMGRDSCRYEDARFVIIPVPYEKNVSWVKGTSNGPRAIIKASQEIEYFDVELMKNISEYHYFTYKNVKYRELPAITKKMMRENKVPIFLGGDHSISIPILNVLPEDVSILHLDAHLDMRSRYLGNPHSHACALYNASKNHKVVHTAIRSGCEEDIENARKYGNKIINPKRIKEIVSSLGKKVYITFDVDALDPSIMPATGTPVPGGISWDTANDILKEVCRTKEIVGIDFVELCPIKGLHACEFLVAKLVMRSMLYMVE